MGLACIVTTLQSERHALCLTGDYGVTVSV